MSNPKKSHRQLYQHMTKYGVEHYYIELIENFPCNNIEECRKKEGECIRELGTLNKLIAGRTNQEYKKRT